MRRKAYIACVGGEKYVSGLGGESWWQEMAWKSYGNIVLLRYDLKDVCLLDKCASRPVAARVLTNKIMNTGVAQNIENLH